MSLDENKNVVRRYQDLHNANQLEALDEVMAIDFISHAPQYPGTLAGLAGAKQSHRINLAVFPDFKVEIQDLIAEGDQVVMRFKAGGTHTGVPLFDVPPSGRRFDIEGISIFRLVNGKIVEHWAVEDELGIMSQLGLISIPPE